MARKPLIMKHLSFESTLMFDIRDLKQINVRFLNVQAAVFILEIRHTVRLDQTDL